MILIMNIILIFVKKSGIQNTGSIIVNISVFQFIPIAFLRNLHISNVGGLVNPTTQHYLKLVDKSKGNHRLCDECGSLCNGLTYTCDYGDLSLHRWCFHTLQEN